MQIEIKDDNTILFNGKTYRAESEPVRHHFVNHITVDAATVEQAEPKWKSEFEVLEYASKKRGGTISLKDGIYTDGVSNFNPNCKIDANALHEYYTIHSIRNKQSGEVLTVGDKVIYLGDIKTIKEIIIGSDNNGMWAISDEPVLTKLNLTCYVPYTEPALPTLQEVFKKVQPRCFVNTDNKVVDIYDDNCAYEGKCQNQLSTLQQCKQLQAFIALRNIADYYNGEVGWKPKSSDPYHFILSKINGEFQVYSAGGGTTIILMEVYFKQREHAEYAISILKEAGLLDALKG